MVFFDKEQHNRFSEMNLIDELVVAVQVFNNEKIFREQTARHFK